MIDRSFSVSPSSATVKLDSVDSACHLLYCISVLLSCKAVNIMEICCRTQNMYASYQKHCRVRRDLRSEQI